MSNEIISFFNTFLSTSQSEAMATFVGIFFLINFVIIIVAFMTLLERRLLGRLQNRIGPNRTGPNGLLQPFADVIKLLTKEDIVIPAADRWPFNIAPLLALMPALSVWIVIPFAPTWILADLDIGILFVIAITGVSVIGVFMSGWASANKFALLGSMRSVASIISYEVPMILAIIAVVLLVGSMSMQQIVLFQSIPLVLVQPASFVIFLLAIVAELNRSPFDIVEAESEIIAGYHTEYTGMKFATFFLAEYTAALAWSAVVVTLFLSGWRIPFVQADIHPFIDGLVFLIKTIFVFCIFVWFRGTWPRLRIDQILGFSWKVLFPIATLNLVITAIEVLVFNDVFAVAEGETLPTIALVAMGLINIAIFIVVGIALNKFIKPIDQEPQSYPVTREGMTL
ncbi:MAG: NADH-quinone oxidoreductase subunit NuoH [SAR202 cluster bacterium]|nr:NADH-quinone oxidoreductase subunit NuoH [SAR202 cluster bacterium]|tara:strand:- start:1273 stop:2463 length:1191 start_codon:yes stop_codon:yes gene_type:complete